MGELTKPVWALVDGTTESGEVQWQISILEEATPHAPVSGVLLHGEPVKVLQHVEDGVEVESATGLRGWLPASLVRVLSPIFTEFTELPMIVLAIGTVLHLGFLTDLLHAIALVREMGRDDLAARLQVAGLRFQAAQNAILLPIADASESESGP